MDNRVIIQILKDLLGEDLLFNIIYKEIRLIEETGNPTTDYYKQLKEIRDLL